MNNERNAITSWPPAIEHETPPAPRVLNKHDQRIIKQQWYYSVVLVFFAWMFFHEHQRLHGFIFNEDTAITWFGFPFFIFQSFQAWILYYRTKLNGVSLK